MLALFVQNGIVLQVELPLFTSEDDVSPNEPPLFTTDTKEPESPSLLSVDELLDSVSENHALHSYRTSWYF